MSVVPSTSALRGPAATVASAPSVNLLFIKERALLSLTMNRTMSEECAPTWSPMLPPDMRRKAGGLQSPEFCRQDMTPLPCLPPIPKAPLMTLGRTAIHVHSSINLPGGKLSPSSSFARTSPARASRSSSDAAREGSAEIAATMARESRTGRVLRCERCLGLLISVGYSSTR